MPKINSDDGKTSSRLYLLEFLIEEIMYLSNDIEQYQQISNNQLVVNFNFLDDVVYPVQSSKIHRVKNLQRKYDRLKVRGIQSCLFSLVEPIDQSTLIITANLYRPKEFTPFGHTVISIENMYALLKELLDCGEKSAYSMFVYNKFEIKSLDNDELIGYLRGCVRLSCFITTET